MIIKINNLGQYGIITDQAAYSLPIGAWSYGKNIRMRDGKLVKFKGHEIYKNTGTTWDGGIGGQIYYLMPVADGSNYYWIFCGLNDVMVYEKDSDVIKEITNAGGDYTATEVSVNWTGGILGGIPVLNNGVDKPQTWDKDFNTPHKLTDIPDFGNFADSCGVMRVFKNYLIALDVTKSSTRYPSLIKWSNSSALGALPTSWDETDPTTEAGEVDLAEKRTSVSVGAALDCMPLRDANIVYMDNSVWSMDFTGGQFIFSFRQIFPNWGILSSKCVAEFEGFHFVVSQGDVYVHDGITAKSVIDNKLKRYFFNNLDPENYRHMFVFANYPETEMWVCYPERNAETHLTTKALVWNWRTQTWGHRDLPFGTKEGIIFGTGYIESGMVETTDANDIWSAGPELSWEAWDVPWNTSLQARSPAIGADIIYKGDSSNSFDRANIISIAERIDIPLGEQGEYYHIKRAYPRIEGGPVDIVIGSQQLAGGTVIYPPAVSFDPKIDKKIDIRMSGTHAAIKIQSNSNVDWQASGIDLEVVGPVARR